MQLDVKVPMRDGINLSADIYLPRARGKFPTVLMRTPYDNNADNMVEKARRLANNGYACIIQDCRGRWDSEGEYYAFREGEDGYDTQEWIGKRDWCNGKIGMAGSSYGGTVQWRSAPYRSQYLKCITPRVICTDYYSGLVHPGGAFQLNVMMTWGMRTNARTAQTIEFHNWTEAFRALPLIEMDEQAGRNLNFWKDWVEHAAYDNYWEQFNDETKWGEIAVPAFNMGGWYDLYAAQTFTNFNGLRLHGHTEEAKRANSSSAPGRILSAYRPKPATLTSAHRQWSIWKVLNSAGSTTGSRVLTTASRMNRLCVSSSWASTNGATNANGRLREPNGKNGTCTPAAVPIRYSAMARSPQHRRRTNRLTTTLTTRTTLYRQWAATTVALPTSYRGVPMTSVP